MKPLQPLSRQSLRIILSQKIRAHHITGRHQTPAQQASEEIESIYRGTLHKYVESCILFPSRLLIIHCTGHLLSDQYPTVCFIN